MAHADPLERQTDRSIVKVALTAMAATSIEWYDFFIYGTAAALVFPTVFFAGDLPPLVAQIASFSTFAVGFVARPMGAVIFGHLGDRVGRKTALVTALMMMGVATTLIGLLPSYAAVGVAAPLSLVLLRFAQGLAIGGQWAGAVLLATENAPSHRRGFYGAFAQVGVPVGLILANLAFLVVSTFVSAEAFLSWGWRVPFLLSCALIGLAMYVQLRLEDTSEFKQLEARSVVRKEQGLHAADDDHAAAAGRSRSPVIEALTTYPREIALAAGAVLATMVTFYIFSTFLIAYGTNPAGLNLPRTTMLTATLISAVLMIPAILTAAAASDKYGRHGIFIAGAVLVGIWGFFLFPLVDTGSLPLIVIGISVGQLFFGMMYGPQAAFLAELFAARVRYSAASLGYQIGAIVGGALAPIIATALIARFETPIAVSFYIAAASTITVISVLLLLHGNPRNKRHMSR